MPPQLANMAWALAKLEMEDLFLRGRPEESLFLRGRPGPLSEMQLPF